MAVKTILKGLSTGRLGPLSNTAPFLPPGYISPLAPPLWIVPLQSDYQYTVKIADVNNNVLEEVPAKNLQYTYTRNDAGSVGFSLPLYNPKTTYALLTPGARNILIYRADTLVWGGRLWAASSDAQTSVMQFSGNGWFSLLLKRYVNVNQNYINIDQLDIAWNLIALAQSNKNLGIHRASTVGSGRLRTRHYPAFERKNIGEALQELSALNNGFDFEITPDLYWQTYYPSKGQAQDIIFETGKNIRSYSVQYDATSLENELTGIGSGDGRATKLSVQSDADSIAAYGLLQGTRSWKDVTKQAILDDHTLEELRLSKNPLIRPEFSIVTNDPPFGAYTVGDTVQVRILDGYNLIDSAYRITTITVAIADSGLEAVEVFFDDQLGQ